MFTLYEAYRLMPSIHHQNNACNEGKDWGESESLTQVSKHDLTELLAPNTQK